MKNRITNDRFSDDFVYVMHSLGITTIGQAVKLMSKVNPGMRIHTTRFAYLRSELDRYIK